MGRLRLVAVVVAAGAMVLSACGQPSAPTKGAGTETSSSSESGATSAAPVTADPAELKAMNDAHAAFSKEPGLGGEVVGLKYGVTKSIAWGSDLNADAYVWENGTLSRAKERLYGLVHNKTFPLMIYRPEDMLAKLAKNGVCTRVEDMSTHVYYSGYRLIDANCNDAKGKRLVQVSQTGEELPPVDAATAEGMQQLWADMLTYGPTTFQIQQYEYKFINAPGSRPGVFITAGGLRTWRYAKPTDGYIFSEIIMGENLTGKPWIPFGRYNGKIFWSAYEATKAQCGSVEKLAVSFESTTAPFETVIVGTAGDCTLKVESTRTTG